MTPKEQAALRAKVDAWIENGGREALAEAVARAKKASKRFRDEARVDWRELSQPMTI